MASAGGVDDLFVGHKQAQHVKENLMTTATEGKRKAAGSRVSTVKTQILTTNPYRLVSDSKQQELESIDCQIAKVTSSKAEAIAFLKRAGIMDSKGDLAKAYRTA